MLVEPGHMRPASTNSFYRSGEVVHGFGGSDDFARFDASVAATEGACAFAIPSSCVVGSLKCGCAWACMHVYVYVYV